MKFYLQQLNSASQVIDSLTLSLNPEEVKVRRGARMQVYNLMKDGPSEIPNGNELSQVTWDGIFPGASRRSMGMISDWKSPKELTLKLNTWKANGTKLRLLVTDTPINIDVYITEFDTTYKGGLGDHFYTIAFKQARDLQITSEGNVIVQNTVTARTITHKKNESKTKRPKPQPADTYIVVAGDTLHSISLKMLGDGKRYMEIFNLNKYPNGILHYPVVEAGQVLKMPTSRSSNLGLSGGGAF